MIREERSFDMLAETYFGFDGSHRVSLVDIFNMPQWATIWGWRPSILNDFVETFTNVSANREDY